jgi:hypothetical protein
MIDQRLQAGWQTDILKPGDEPLTEWVERGKWHSSKGYPRADGLIVGAHEYILRREEPELFAALRARLQGDDAYHGWYGGYRYRYVNLAGYKYWAFNTVLNRERLPEDV